MMYIVKIQKIGVLSSTQSESEKSEHFHSLPNHSAYDPIAYNYDPVATRSIESQATNHSTSFQALQVLPFSL